MSDLLQSLKDRPVLSIGSALLVASSIVWAFLWAWSEFAHSSDITRIEMAQKADHGGTIREIQINRLSGEIGILDLQIRDARNRLLDLAAKPRTRSLNDPTAIATQRYAQELTALEADRRTKAAVLERLKAGIPTP